MKLIVENWKRFLNETQKKMSPEEALRAEGGAIGYSKWEELTGMSRQELEAYVEENPHIKTHKHGDIINSSGLQSETNLEEIVVSEEDDRCTRIAKRKYDVWPSAYASGAVVKCRDGKIWKDES